MTKRYIRKIAKIRRQLLSKQKKSYYDILIFRRLKSILSGFRFENVFIYLNLPYEVDTGRIIKYLFSKGKKIYVPKLVTKNNMVAAQLTHKSILKKNEYGIKEPIEYDVASPDTIDICIIPLVAFDKYLNRIGFGKGFYDRFLQNVRDDCVKIGIGYHKQMFECIIPDKHDVKLNLIVTERTIITGKKQKKS